MNLPRLMPHSTPPHTVTPTPHTVTPAKMGFAIGAVLTLSACAGQVSTAVQPGAPGFLFGLWHGFIFPVAWVISLFMDDVSVYAVPNNGGWYDFGYFLGIVVFGVGARKSHIVYRDRIVRVK